MEINRLDEVIPVIPTADVVEGMLGLQVAQTFTYDFGSRTDLSGFRVPATAEEAKRSRWIITWAVDNRQPPYYVPQPSYTFGLRQNFEQTANLPMTNTTVWMTYPGYKNCETIPSGTPSLAFGHGTYTVTSCNYINSASFAAGAMLIVANTAEDGASNAGKLKYQSTYDSRVVGIVEEWDSTNKLLTFNLHP